MVVSADPVGMRSLSEVAASAADAVADVATTNDPGDMGHPDVYEALLGVLITHRHVAERAATDLQQAAVYVATINSNVQLADSPG